MISVELREKLEITINVDTIDYYNTSPLLKSLNEAIQKHQMNIIINFEKVSFIDSSGIAMFAGLMQRNAAVHRNIMFVNISSELRAIFRAMNLEGFFKLR